MMCKKVCERIVCLCEGSKEAARQKSDAIDPATIETRERVVADELVVRQGAATAAAVDGRQV